MTRTFTCGICREHHTSDWTEAEARAEAESRWGELPEGATPETDDRMVSICDECDESLMTIVRAIGLHGTWDEPPNDDRWQVLDSIRCIGCNKVPAQIEEYREAVADEGKRISLISCIAYVVSEEGTFNAENGHFACTECYVALGMPTEAGSGWKAP